MCLPLGLSAQRYGDFVTQLGVFTAAPCFLCSRLPKGVRGLSWIEGLLTRIPNNLISLFRYLYIYIIIYIYIYI